MCRGKVGKMVYILRGGGGFRGGDFMGDGDQRLCWSVLLTNVF